MGVKTSLGRINSRGAVAYTLFQSGQGIEAGTLFAKAEQMQQQYQRDSESLHSLQGFQYCDWLLAPAEKAAWQHLQYQPRCVGEFTHSDGLATVESRALQAHGIAVKNRFLLDVALNCLNLARAALIRSVLASPMPKPALVLPQVAASVNGLRAAGTMDYLPIGLLTAALYHFVRGEHDLARKHLVEAQQIAERGPMPLFLADVHLHRARMFCDKAELAQASQLIRGLGYGRRYEELADAEVAAEHWPACS